MDRRQFNSTSVSVLGALLLLYLMIGDEEKKIRQDPVGTGSAVLKKVFGALK